jgi:hypothetical protein
MATNPVTSMWNALNGWKSYLGMVVLGLLGIAKLQAWITPEQFEMWAYILGSWTGIGIAHKLDKNSKK